MGNFLFQAAAAMSYAWDHGLDFTMPKKEESTDLFWSPIYLPHLVNPTWNPTLPKITIEEKQFHFNPIPFKREWKDCNILLDGYWQSEKYFKHYREELLQKFGFPWECKTGTVSVHVRRGDYLRLVKKHPYVGVAWIDSQMEKFPDCVFKFYSDDIAWCKATFGMRKNCLFSEGRTPEQDLIKMSCCEHHICSASTFSWWGAWLNRNQNKRVILPKQWFVAGHGGLDTRDIVPVEWERV